MTNQLYSVHPGLAGAAVGLTTGAIVAQGTFDSNVAAPGLNQIESIWLLIATMAILYALPLLAGYFSYYAYLGLQATLPQSKSWRIIAIIAAFFGLAYALSLVVLFTQPEKLASAGLHVILGGYAVISLLLLFLFYRVPWLDRGRQICSAARADSIEPNARTSTTRESPRVRRASSEKARTQ